MLRPRSAVRLTLRDAEKSRNGLATALQRSRKSGALF